MARPAQASPWQALFKLAVKQEGLFSARQATSAGCSQQLLAKYVASGRVERVQRGLYRITDFPVGEHEELVSIWLWSRNEGVFSHETALFLHNLSDALPIRAHITLPSSWETRTVRSPEDTAVYYGDIVGSDRVWVGPVPVTSVRRTLSDCLHGATTAELVAQASTHAAERGLIRTEEVLTAAAVTLWRHR